MCVYDYIRNLKILLFLYFAADGYVYKLVEWYDRLGEEHSNLVDIFEATVPDAVRAIEISSKVSKSKIYICQMKVLFYVSFRVLLFFTMFNIIHFKYTRHIKKALTMPSSSQRLVVRVFFKLLKGLRKCKHLYYDIF